MRATSSALPEEPHPPAINVSNGRYAKVLRRAPGCAARSGPRSGAVAIMECGRKTGGSGYGDKNGVVAPAVVAVPPLVLHPIGRLGVSDRVRGAAGDDVRSRSECHGK